MAGVVEGGRVVARGMQLEDSSTDGGEAVLQGEGRVEADDREVDGRDYTLLSTGGAIYAHEDVMFWMVNMSFLGSGLYVDQQVDVDLVEATVAQLPG